MRRHISKLYLCIYAFTDALISSIVPEQVLCVDTTCLPIYTTRSSQNFRILGSNSLQ